MLFLLLSWLGGASHAGETTTVFLTKLCPPTCLGIKEFDTERRPHDLTEEWDRALAGTGGLHSLLVSVDPEGGAVEVVVNGVLLNDDNVVDKMEDEDGDLVYWYRIPVGPSDGLYVEITNVGEKETGYEVVIEGTSEEVR
jgi:hypothetical protein